MLSQETALEIAYAYREVETAEKLLADVRKAIDEEGSRESDIRDAFGRRQTGLQLGVPSGQNAHRLFNVPFALAEPVIKAHIAHHLSRIEVLSIAARAELAQSTTLGQTP